jgi:hypothetical protein
MAHFAEINAEGIVLRVIVVDDAVADDGRNWCNALLGGEWRRTYYSGRLRKNFAGPGFTYDAERDAFIAPQPDPTWVLDEETCTWAPPTEG